VTDSFILPELSVGADRSRGGQCARDQVRVLCAHERAEHCGVAAADGEPETVAKGVHVRHGRDERGGVLQRLLNGQVDHVLRGKRVERMRRPVVAMFKAKKRAVVSLRQGDDLSAADAGAAQLGLAAHVEEGRTARLIVVEIRIVALRECAPLRVLERRHLEVVDELIEGEVGRAGQRLGGQAELQTGDGVGRARRRRREQLGLAQVQAALLLGLPATEVVGVALTQQRKRHAQSVHDDAVG